MKEKNEIKEELDLIEKKEKEINEQIELNTQEKIIKVKIKMKKGIKKILKMIK